MDIEIVIKGGVELSEWYPEKYAAFEEKILKMMLDEFPGVSGCWLRSELTPRHAEEKAAREQIKQDQFEQTLIGVLEQPGVRELIRNKATASAE